MKRIIVPTDFSDTAWNATFHALQYCKIFDAELILIHVFEHSSNSLNVNSINISDSLTKEENQMKDLLIKINAFEEFKDVKMKSTCVEGSLFDCLKKLLSNQEGELIIMGTNGRTGSFQKLFGSNTSRLMKEIDCPILVIPPGFEFSLSTPVTCAIDFGSKLNPVDLGLIERLVKIGTDSVFKIIHIVKDFKDPNKKLPLDQFINLNVTYDELVGNSVSGLLERYSLINKSRLLVLVKKEKGFLESFFQASVTSELAVNANVPLMILRSGN